MRLKVHAHKIDIIKDESINEKEINISKCIFEFDEEINDNFVKKAYFTLDKGETYEETILNNECKIPYEVLKEKGSVEVGVVAYIIENEEEIKRYNPSPAHFLTWKGSLKDDVENSEPITPTDKEQIEQMLANINLSISKSGKITTISFTNTDGETQTEVLEDGMGLQFNWNGTSLGVKREDEQSYDYVNLKGDKGDPGSIKFIIVQTLPTENIEEDAMYLVPLQTPESQENKFAEYIYVNGEWELLGKISIHVDLSNYYTKQEVNSLIPTKTSDLTNDSDYTTKTYVDGLVGDINTALDTINGEVI